MESLHLVIVVFNMDNNIKKKGMELTTMNCMTSLYTIKRLRMRVIETKVLNFC